MHDNPASPYGSVATTYMTLLEQAFCIASQDVQGALNKLDYVFVTTDASWQYGDVGVWSAKNGMKYIIITSSTLDRILKTSSLAGEENDLYTKLFNISPFSDSGAGSSEAAALAVLGHELGHVVFAATNADGRPGKNPRNLPIPNQCFYDSILSAWDETKYNPRRWVDFGDRNGNAYGDPNINFGTIGGSPIMITHLYQHTPLVSLFASASPEEDFVETFKYHALASATEPLDLNIDGISNAVSRVKPSSGTGTTIGAKVSCIFTVLLPNMPAPTVNP
jgi:hypothetical protein